MNCIVYPYHSLPPPLILVVFCSAQVAVLTGFPCMVEHTPPTETDGPPGALAVARACLGLGKSVRLLIDEVSALRYEGRCCL